jgi:hypothetical protein
MRETIATCYSVVNSILLIPSDSTLLCNRGMENKEIRRANLILLIGEYGSVAALAEKTDIDPTYLTNIKNRAQTSRGLFQMGDEVARRIEQKLGKGNGWMDQLQNPRLALPDDQQELLEAYEKAQEDWKRGLRSLAAYDRVAQLALLQVLKLSPQNTIVPEAPLPEDATTSRRMKKFRKR